MYYTQRYRCNKNDPKRQKPSLRNMAVVYMGGIHELYCRQVEMF